MVLENAVEAKLKLFCNFDSFSNSFFKHPLLIIDILLKKMVVDANKKIREMAQLKVAK